MCGFTVLGVEKSFQKPFPHAWSSGAFLASPTLTVPLASEVMHTPPTLQ